MSEPNKYAGFLARQEHLRDPWRGVGVKCVCGKVFDLDADHALHQVEEILCAALVAAQGAAPQAEGECTMYCFDLPVTEHHDGCEALAAPVLPSSTVDEHALAEMIREALRDDRLRVAYGAPVNKPQYVVVARAVAEWLKEQGR